MPRRPQRPSQALRRRRLARCHAGPSFCPAGKCTASPGLPPRRAAARRDERSATTGCEPWGMGKQWGGGSRGRGGCARGVRRGPHPSGCRFTNVGRARHGPSAPRRSSRPVGARRGVQGERGAGRGRRQVGAPSRTGRCPGDQGEELAGTGSTARPVPGGSPGHPFFSFDPDARSLDAVVIDRTVAGCRAGSSAAAARRRSRAARAATRRRSAAAARSARPPRRGRWLGW